jgi:hypothetical protein
LDFLQNLGLNDRYWRFVLPPGWQEQDFRDILDIAIFQYLESMKWAEKDLQDSEISSEVITVQYEKLSSNTESVIQRLLSFTELSNEAYDFDTLRSLPKINVTKNIAADDSIRSEIIDRLEAVKTDLNVEI